MNEFARDASGKIVSPPDIPDMAIERGVMDRVTCPACGWTSTVANDDQLKRSLRAKRAAHEHRETCPELAKAARRWLVSEYGYHESLAEYAEP